MTFKLTSTDPLAILDILSAAWTPDSLEPFTVPCDAPRDHGRPCGEIAVVRNIDYGSPGDRGNTETIYTINCPRCGCRTQRG